MVRMTVNIEIDVLKSLEGELAFNKVMGCCLLVCLWYNAFRVQGVA